MRTVAASGEITEAVLPYGIVQQLADAAATVSPDALAALEVPSHGPGPGANPLAVGVELRALISATQRNSRP